MDLPKIRKKVTLWAGFFLIFLFVISLSYFRVFDNYELETLDIRYKLRPNIPVNKNIVIIEIGDYTIDKLGKWPISRRYHAALVNALTEAGASAIVFDVFFSEDSDIESDIALERAIEKSKIVYLPHVFNIISQGNMKLPIADRLQEAVIDKFKKHARGTGFINILPDSDGKFRRVPPIIKFDNTLFPHVCFLVASDYLGIKRADLKIQPGKYVELGDELKVPLDLNSTIIVNFPGKWSDTFRHYSYIDVLDSHVSFKLPLITKKKPIVNLKELKGSVCFVGVTATATPDAHPSPFDSLYPGVGVNASLFNSFLTKNFVRRISPGLNVIILLLLCFITFLVSRRYRAFYGLLWTAVFILGYGIIAIVLFFTYGIWIDIFYPITVIFFLYLAITFTKYISEIQKMEIVDRDLSIARRIQESFLPKEKPNIPSIDIAAKMETAKQVGGDLYDFFCIDQNKLGVMIGDVSGKGVPAALYMAKVVSEFKTCASGCSASNAILRLNNRLCKEGGSGLFVTLSYLIFNVNDKTLDYSSGGHLPMLIAKINSEKIEKVDVDEGTPLGLFEGVFGTKTLKFEKGDLFVLYTDGVTEAMNPKGEMFGEERLIELIKETKSLSLQEIVDKVQNEVSLFEGKDRQHDDITVMVLKSI